MMKKIPVLYFLDLIAWRSKGALDKENIIIEYLDVLKNMRPVTMIATVATSSQYFLYHTYG